MTLNSGSKCDFCDGELYYVSDYGNVYCKKHFDEVKKK